MRLIDADALIQKLVTNGWLKMDSLKDSAEMIAVQAAIDDAPTIVPPLNNPLTLEELREMDGEPVWLKDGRCFIINGDLGYENHGLYTSLIILADIGLYRRKPEEGAGCKT